MKKNYMDFQDMYEEGYKIEMQDNNWRINRLNMVPQTVKINGKFVRDKDRAKKVYIYKKCLKAWHTYLTDKEIVFYDTYQKEALFDQFIKNVWKKRETDVQYKRIIEAELDYLLKAWLK